MKEYIQDRIRTLAEELRQQYAKATGRPHAAPLADIYGELAQHGERQDALRGALLMGQIAGLRGVAQAYSIQLDPEPASWAGEEGT